MSVSKIPEYHHLLAIILPVTAVLLKMFLCPHDNLHVFNFSLLHHFMRFLYISLVSFPSLDNRLSYFTDTLINTIDSWLPSSFFFLTLEVSPFPTLSQSSSQLSVRFLYSLPTEHCWR